MRTKVVSVLAAVGLACGLGVAVAGPASAAASAVASAVASDCWPGSENRWWCENVPGAPVYGWIGNNHIYPDPDRVVGHMYSNPSWFYCKMDGQDWVGGPHPTRWLMTVADNGELGFMKDTAVYSETDPLPDC